MFLVHKRVVRAVCGSWRDLQFNVRVANFLEGTELTSCKPSSLTWPEEDQAELTGLTAPARVAHCADGFSQHQLVWLTLLTGHIAPARVAHCADLSHSTGSCGSLCWRVSQHLSVSLTVLTCLTEPVRVAHSADGSDSTGSYGSLTPQSEIYRRGNVENDWNSSVVRRSPSKAIIGFPIISDYFQCPKCRFPDVFPRRKCQGFCALKSSEFQLKHALCNSLSMYFH